MSCFRRRRPKFQIRAARFSRRRRARTSRRRHFRFSDGTAAVNYHAVREDGRTDDNSTIHMRHLASCTRESKCWLTTALLAIEM